MCIPFLLLIALANRAHLLSTCLAGENGTLYSEGRAYKKALKLVPSPQSTALHPIGNISAEDSVCKKKVGHNSTCGIVSPLLFFLRKYCCTSNILCGLRLLIQDVYRKEKLSLAMSISKSNEHILDKTMFKICGLTICLIRVSVQWLTCWHCSLF
jgi:hypothetical protein